MTEHPGLPVWTIYERPRDYPKSYVVRRWVVRTGDGAPKEPEKDEHPWAIVPTIEAARMSIPPGLVCIARQDGDEPQIVETWL